MSDTKNLKRRMRTFYSRTRYLLILFIYYDNNILLITVLYKQDKSQYFPILAVATCLESMFNAYNSDQKILVWTNLMWVLTKLV